MPTSQRHNSTTPVTEAPRGAGQTGLEVETLGAARRDGQREPMGRVLISPGRADGESAHFPGVMRKLGEIALACGDPSSVDLTTGSVPGGRKSKRAAVIDQGLRASFRGSF